MILRTPKLAPPLKLWRHAVSVGVLDTEYWMLDAGCWMLVAGCWLLVAGYWMKGKGGGEMGRRGVPGIHNDEILMIIEEFISGSYLLPMHKINRKFEL